MPKTGSASSPASYSAHSSPGPAPLSASMGRPRIPSISPWSLKDGSCWSHKINRYLSAARPCMLTESLTLTQLARTGPETGMVSPLVPNLTSSNEPCDHENVEDLEKSNSVCEPQVVQLLAGRRSLVEPVSIKTLLLVSSMLANTTNP